MQINGLADITLEHRHVFLSPHFDDAVFSCGGTLSALAANGQRPLVVTIFAGDPDPEAGLSVAAVSKHQKMGLTGSHNAVDATTRRRAEDIEALTLCNADHLWLDEVDALYRGNPPRYPQRTDYIGGHIHPDDQPLITALGSALLEVQHRLPDMIWYAPLAVGHHVDHQIVHAVAANLANHGGRVLYYEDMSYALTDSALQNRLTELAVSLSAPMLIDISDTLALRINAGSCYRSQLLTNFGSREGLATALTLYTRHADPTRTGHVERYWALHAKPWTTPHHVLKL